MPNGIYGEPPASRPAPTHCCLAWAETTTCRWQSSRCGSRQAVIRDSPEPPPKFGNWLRWSAPSRTRTTLKAGRLRHASDFANSQSGAISGDLAVAAARDSCCGVGPGHPRTEGMGPSQKGGGVAPRRGSSPGGGDRSGQGAGRNRSRPARTLFEHVARRYLPRTKVTPSNANDRPDGEVTGGGTARRKRRVFGSLMVPGADARTGLRRACNRKPLSSLALSGGR